MKIFKLLLPLFLISTLLSGQGLKTSGKKIVNADGDEVILRGIGLGGWMLMEGYMMQSSDVADTQHEFKDRLIDLMGEANTSEFFDAWLENHVTQADVDSLASWGYNSIRLPMHYNLFTLPIEEEPVAGQNTWLEKGFDMVDSLLEWCSSNNLYLILDLHAAPGGQGANAAISDYDPSKPSLWESVENRNKTVALWTKLAGRYHDEPWIGGYDLLNEVNWNLPGNVMLKALYKEITDSIRAVDPNHILFIEGNGFANDFTGLTPPWDENMAYSFHKYWNYNDPGSIQWVLDIREQHDVPLWMGEAGENSNVWFFDAITLFESNGIGWSWWPMKRIETIVGPYSILFTQGYKDVLDYWRGQGPQPTATEAFDAMMELAYNTNSANCLYRKDVHDTKIRQVMTEETKPFTDHHVPGVVHMSDFDLGRINIAYYDVDYANYSQSTGEFQAWNSGWHYRNDAVDIEPNNDAINSNGYHIGYVQEGEWMNYTVNIADSASYTARFRVASEQAGGEFHLSLDGQDITQTQSVGSTNGWVNFVDLEVPEVILYGGEHVLTFYIDDSPFNVSSVEFLSSGTIEEVDFYVLNGQTRADEKSLEVVFNHPVKPESITGSTASFSVFVNGEERPINVVMMEDGKDRTVTLLMEDFKVYTDNIEVSYSGDMIKSVTGKNLAPFTGLAIRNTLPFRFILPKRIQAEDYFTMVGMGTEECTDLGGGRNLGWTDAGDYADYLIYNHEEGFFEVEFRVASLGSQGLIGISLLDSDSAEVELFTIATPPTGGWQTWTTISENIAIPPGGYTLRMKVLTGGFNLNWIDLLLLDGFDDAFMQGKLVPRTYPNPVKHDHLSIDFGEVHDNSVQIDIYSLSGSLISSRVYPVQDSMATIDVSQVPSGVYVLKMIVDNSTFSSRIIRQ